MSRRVHQPNIKRIRALLRLKYKGIGLGGKKKRKKKKKDQCRIDFLDSVPIISFCPPKSFLLKIQRARRLVPRQTCQLPGGFPLRRFSCWYDAAAGVRAESTTRLDRLPSSSSSSSWLRCNLCKWCKELEERLLSRISPQIRSSCSTVPTDRPGEQHGDATTWTAALMTDEGGGGRKIWGRCWMPRMGVVGPVAGELGCGFITFTNVLLTLGWISQGGAARPLTVDISVAHVEDRPIEANGNREIMYNRLPQKD